MGKISFALALSLLCVQILSISGQTYLRADGTTDTYTLINRVLGGTAVEVPDCKHNEKHIWQGNDGQLNRQVFYFHAHVNQDDDRCVNSDRQRTEIKTYNPSPNALKGFQHETVYLSWNFKLDAGFQPSNSFTHIHQLKAVDGDDSMPIITLTPRKGSPDVLQVIHVSSSGTSTNLGSVPLAPFKGNWVHVTQQSTYSSSGSYSVTIKNLSTGATLMSVTRSNLDMWRSGASFVRPKWGIYRSLANKSQLRDETVRFDTFCLGKGSSRCT